MGTRGRRRSSVVASRHIFSGNCWNIRVISSRKENLNGAGFCIFNKWVFFLYNTDLLFTSYCGELSKLIESPSCQRCLVKKVWCFDCCTYALSSYHAKTWMCPNPKCLTTWKCCSILHRPAPGLFLFFNYFFYNQTLVNHLLKPVYLLASLVVFLFFFSTLLQVLNPRQDEQKESLVDSCVS